MAPPYKIKLEEILEGGFLVSNLISDDLLKQNQLTITIKQVDEIDSSQLFCFMNITYTVNLPNTPNVKTPVLTLDMCFKYYVENLIEIVNSEGSSIENSQLRKLVAFLSYNYCHGIVYEKSKGTEINDYYLPILSPASFTKEVVVRENEYENT